MSVFESPAFSLDDAQCLRRLETHYEEVSRIILARQHPITGLLPASTAVTCHGDYTHAWVRDNVYSILAVWGLALAYRKRDVDHGRTYQLEQSVVKLMRGLLFAMMRQAPKVERFKRTQDPRDALHAKYDTASGQEVVGDTEWGHLQLDATSLFLLMLTQMTASGLRIVFNQDEVSFIQNLVWYLSRAYSIPDYGIWERGNKINTGQRELNASSIGMVLAALQSIQAFDLYGGQGEVASVIHVLPDDIARTEITLKSILPRESGSKEVDAALLSVVGFPAFAVSNPELVALTQRMVIDKLAGRYGCKRFLRDGHQTAIEDTHKLHYEPEELLRFEHIESEWPLFFTYLLLNGLFFGDKAMAREYRERLEPLFVERDGLRLLPELYYVPQEYIDAERAAPGSQPRLPNENQPLVWAQSLFILAALIQDGFLETADIDPLGRSRRVGRRVERAVMVALIAEDEQVQARLEEAGIVTEPLSAIGGIDVREPSLLAEALSRVGENTKLLLSGRPPRRLRALTTSRVYWVGSRPTVFQPQVLNTRDFYLGHDSAFLVKLLKAKISYVHRYWRLPGKPLITLVITRGMLREPGFTECIEFLRDELLKGQVDGVPVRAGRLAQLIPLANSDRLPVCFKEGREGQETAIPTDSTALRGEVCATRPLLIDELMRLESASDESLLTWLASTGNLHEQVEILVLLARRQGLSFDTGLRDAPEGPSLCLREVAERLFFLAADWQFWAVLRRSADLLGKVDANLETAVIDILVRQKQLAVGRAYSRRAILHEPMPNEAVMERIRLFCGEDERERILTQELIIHLGMLIRADSGLFRGIITLRVGHLLQLMVAELARERRCPPGEAFDWLLDLAPHEINERLREVLAHYGAAQARLQHTEALHLAAQPGRLVKVIFNAELDRVGPELESAPVSDWYHWRQVGGTLGRMSADFHSGVWNLLRHGLGVVIGDKYNRKNYLESRVLLAQSTAGEKNFALLVDHRLNRIASPEYRQLCIEALEALIAVVRVNPTLRIDDWLVLDVIIGHAVRLARLEAHPEDSERYNEVRDLAWSDFYRLPPHKVANSIVWALDFLLEKGEQQAIELAGESTQP
ncbi:MAG: glycoside hydrolase family 15 protein [Pseudomonadota bacterium]